MRQQQIVEQKVIHLIQLICDAVVGVFSQERQDDPVQRSVERFIKYPSMDQFMSAHR